ncbi:unnamed protein product [Notodromas monacha]|uniref:Uncharacterized protein n=1 Tax=Notodromas monacha TaxID=399045 RepID=A0A7R9BDI4_9CRUS|nr:unnamed protein product [Notodromas monacha]CAG0913389.1 unnamed protein product [Notodromas monacha]
MNDFSLDTVTLFTGSFFTSWEYFIPDDMEQTPQWQYPLHSVVITGSSPWTLYTQKGYTGASACLYPGQQQNPGLYPTAAYLGNTAGWVVKSVRRGCHATTQLRSINADERNSDDVQRQYQGPHFVRMEWIAFSFVVVAFLAAFVSSKSAYYLHSEELTNEIANQIETSRENQTDSQEPFAPNVSTAIELSSDEMEVEQGLSWITQVTEHANFARWETGMYGFHPPSQSANQFVSLYDERDLIGTHWNLVGNYCPDLKLCFRNDLDDKISSIELSGILASFEMKLVPDEIEDYKFGIDGDDGDVLWAWGVLSAKLNLPDYLLRGFLEATRCASHLGGREIRAFSQTRVSSESAKSSPRFEDALMEQKKLLDQQQRPKITPFSAFNHEMASMTRNSSANRKLQKGATNQNMKTIVFLVICGVAFGASETRDSMSNKPFRNAASEHGQAGIIATLYAEYCGDLSQCFEVSLDNTISSARVFGIRNCGKVPQAGEGSGLGRSGCHSTLSGIRFAIDWLRRMCGVKVPSAWYLGETKTSTAPIFPSRGLARTATILQSFHFRRDIGVSPLKDATLSRATWPSWGSRCVGLRPMCVGKAHSWVTYPT